MAIETIDLEEIAAALKINRRDIAAKLMLLRRTAGFPAPLPTMKGLYSRPMVEAWFNHPPPQENIIGLADYLSEARRRRLARQRAK